MLVESFNLISQILAKYTSSKSNGIKALSGGK